MAKKKIPDNNEDSEAENGLEKLARITTEDNLDSESLNEEQMKGLKDLLGRTGNIVAETRLEDIKDAIGKESEPEQISGQEELGELEIEDAFRQEEPEINAEPQEAKPEHGRIKDARHAAFMNEFVKRFQDEGYDVKIEVPYNYYGQRGVIDVVMTKDDELYVCEIKTVLVDIGDAIRQVTKAKSFFTKALPEYAKYENKFYPLFIDSENFNFQVLSRNAELFRGIRVIFWNDSQETRYNERWEKILLGDFSIEDENAEVTNYACMVCNDELEEEKALCPQCIDMFKVTFAVRNPLTVDSMRRY